MARTLLLPSRRFNPQAYTNKIKTLAPANLIAYWPLADPVGSVTASDASGHGCVGAYNNVTLGVVGIGDGRSAAGFDPAVSSYVNTYSAALAALWNGQEFTIAYWGKSFDWAGTPFKRPYTFRADGSNQITHGIGTINTLTTTYIANGISKTNALSPVSPTGWYFHAVTVSLGANEMKIYYYDATRPFAQVPSTIIGLGTYVGTLDPVLCMIGAGGATPGNYWNGSLADVAIWNTPLSLAQLATIATI